MPAFNYIAKDKDGKRVSGVAEARDNQELIEMLRDKGLIIISVNETKGKPATEKTSFFAQRVKQDDLVIFSRQLSTMVSAGITLVNALNILGEQVENKTFKDVILDVRDEIESGKSLSEGMAKHRNVFSDLFVNMVRAGETSGTLDEILDRVALYLEKTSSLQKKVKSALIYPAVVTVMALSITIVLLIKVIPVFKDIYSGFDAALPAPTAMLISVSDSMRKYFWLVIIILSLIIFMVSRFIKTDKGRHFIDGRLLKMPIFGVIFSKVAISKFTRTFSTLIKSGVSILTCLEIVGKTSGNKVVEKAVEEVRSSIREGETIAVPLQRSGIFPPMVVRMISVGEKTGELDKMLSKIADFYDDQVDAAVSGLTSMIEPLIIAFLGVVIGTVVICMFLPIFKLSTIVAM